MFHAFRSFPIHYSFLLLTIILMEEGSSSDSYQSSESYYSPESAKSPLSQPVVAIHLGLPKPGRLTGGIKGRGGLGCECRCVADGCDRLLEGGVGPESSAFIVLANSDSFLTLGLGAGMGIIWARVLSIAGGLLGAIVGVRDRGFDI
ncbi:hypothetical protein K469DRAFT_289787 [Zopfia rhizophila CBS 207.26]|uniref:Uncharacterized protein n=1 Tax=Zopfia rhizophila CBS 207.26 TaxID=1314779 RepID=A0A6A6DRD4_9PEZI|nr:hypothetical protein K469DRAFT_289787 [Zopfia rhizophila CBS 207.26]